MCLVASILDSTILEHSSHYPEWDKLNTNLWVNLKGLHNDGVDLWIQVLRYQEKKWKEIMIVVSQKRPVTEQAFNTTCVNLHSFIQNVLNILCEWQQAEKNEVLCFSKEIGKWMNNNKEMNYCIFHWFNGSIISCEIWFFFPCNSFFPTLFLCITSTVI